MKKQYLKSRPICKVTFRLPSDTAAGAESAAVVGEFNQWSDELHPMKRLKNGSFKVTIDLEQGNEYQFRYLLDGRVWQNDDAADAYQPSGFGDAENSVVRV